MIGITFEGGGTRGSYQVGSYLAFRDCHIRPNGVCGTSIGSFNGAMIAAKQEKELLELDNRLKEEENSAKNELLLLKQQHTAELKAKDEQIEFYKYFKAKQSTKQIGESLEQYCHDEFNKIRMTAFPNAYFEKDNEYWNKKLNEKKENYHQPLQCSYLLISEINVMKASVTLLSFFEEVSM